MKNFAQAIQVPQEETIIIGQATTFEEKREIFRLRYQVYAEEIAYNFVSIDHENRLLYDDFDEKALILYAKIGSKIIGTGRVNIGKLSDFPSDIVQTYRMDKFKKFYSKDDDPYFAIISKVMILPQYRSSSTMYLIMANLYNLHRDYQVQFAFINCSFHLIPFYERSGYVRIDKNTVDSNDGSSLSSLVLLVDDVQYLKKVGSLLYRIARQRTSLNQKVVDWFNSEFSRELDTIVNSQLVTADKLWSIIYNYMGGAPNNIIPILNDLSMLESKLFLHSCSTIVHCHKGDYITVEGNTSQELITLLSGKAQSSLDGVILPGQYCGENGLVNRSRHFSSVIALEDADFLVLSFSLFSNFRKRHPNIERKILDNLQQQICYPIRDRMASSTLDCTSITMAQ